MSSDSHDARAAAGARLAALEEEVHPLSRTTDCPISVAEPALSPNVVFSD